MASNAIQEKSKKTKPAAGILGYFQKKTSPSETENITSVDIVGDSVGSGEKKSEETSPGIDKENKSKLLVKMKPRGVKKKRKKIEMEEDSSEDDIDLDVLLNVKKKKKKIKLRVSSGEESRPSSTEPKLDIEKVVTVPKPQPQPQPVEISTEEVTVDPGESKTPDPKPKKSISSFFQKVTKEERLQKVEKDNSFVEVKALIHDSPENPKSTNLKTSFPKLKSPSISKKPRKSRKSNVSISAAETDKIELLEVEEIVEKTQEEEDEKKVLNVDDDKEGEKHLESDVRKISNNLFRKNKTKRKIAIKCKNDVESDDSVSMESLQNSPVKNLPSATSSPLKKSLKIEDSGQTESLDEKMDCSEGKENTKSEEPEPEPEPSKDLKKIPRDEKLKNMLSVLQSVEDLGEDSDTVAPLIPATPKNSRTPKAKKKKYLQVPDEKPLDSPEIQIEKSEIPESPSVGRRSGRIARKSSLIEEKKRIQEEQEKRLEESDRKIELERKIRNAAVAKQKKLLAAKSSESRVSPSPDPESVSDSDSDCQIEEEEQVVASPRRKKPDKLASIFTKNKKPEKPAEDPAVVAARKAFLMSAAPETLRTQMCRAGEEEREERGVVWPSSAGLPSHTGLEPASLSSQSVQLRGGWRISADMETSLVVPPPVLSLKTTPEDQSGLDSRQVVRMSEASVLATVESRVKNNSWPGLGMLNSLIERKVKTEMLEVRAREAKVSVNEVKAKDGKRGRGKKRRSRRSVEVARPGDGGRYQVEAGSGLIWTRKYEPQCGGEVLGNSGEVARLRDWLSTWTSGGGRTRGGGSASTSNSELTTDSEFESDVEPSETPGGNTALIVGPTGCGKTASVFALAAELGFNVLEVNASRNRTGKQILSMLSEATKSQQVRRGEDKKGTFFSSLTLVKKPTEEEASGRKMKTALILLEDIDVVFDDLDEGFYSAVNTLSLTSKRPIVMTVSQPTWHLTGNGSVGEKVLKFPPQMFIFENVGEEELARHLQTIAMVEGHHISRSEVKSKVMKAVTDVRYAMLQLQFYCNSGLDQLDGPQEENEVEGEERDEGGVDVREWFSHLDSSTLSAGQLTPAGGIKTDLASPWSYSSQQWWDSLPGEKIRPGPRLRKYPLSTSSNDQFKRINPLKNKAFFDTEESSEEAETEEKLEDLKPAKEQSRPLCKEERARNYRALSSLSSHLETVSQWSLEQDSHGWQIVNPRPEGGQSQEFAEERDEEEERREVGNLYTRPILSLSAAAVEKAVEPEICSLHQLQPDIVSEMERVTDAQLEAYTSGLVDIFLVDRKGRLDLLAGLRELARGEELKSIQCGGSKRKSKKFFHYFQQNDAFLKEETLQSLCNALVD